MLFLGGNVNEIVRKTLHYYPIRYFFRHLFFDRRWPTFFFKLHSIYFFIRLIKNLLLNIRTLKDKTKNVKF
jgi:hypothetical protein